ncbi:rap1 GTPase-GDP dissociation stimulator 1-A [Latimeria chalumnae]|uniref:rap1 GTPase-GDP dissociation stimulator 1-A n=1 Tax=Latimeria chalumnae TaxID=7897 RepID=UPI00313DB053
MNSQLIPATLEAVSYKRKLVPKCGRRAEGQEQEQERKRKRKRSSAQLRSAQLSSAQLSSAPSPSQPYDSEHSDYPGKQSQRHFLEFSSFIHEGYIIGLVEFNQRASVLLSESGVLPLLSGLLKRDPPFATKVAKILAELAKYDEMKKPCIEAGLVPALLPLLDSNDQEILLHAGRAIGRICFENSELQEQLVEMGVISPLVRILSEFSENDTLVHVCLLALSNLAELESAKEALARTNVAGELVKQLRMVKRHEKEELILEVLQMLAENDVLKLLLVEAGIHEALSEVVKRLQDSSQLEDMCSVKAASDLIVSLLLGDESMQKLFADGDGPVYQIILSWLVSSNSQLQLAGALAIANFARNDSNCVRMVELRVVMYLLKLLEQHVENGDVSVQHAALSALRNLAIPVVNKVRMLKDGVAQQIQTLLRSEMPPVQFKLLGTLRMLIDGQATAAEELGQDLTLLDRLIQWCDAKEHAGVQGEANRLLASLIRHSKSQEVVRAVLMAQGVKHLVSMARSEHVIMQNEALIALAIASAIDIEAVEDSFRESELVQTVHKLLEDEITAPEVKFNSMGLLCSLLNSGDLKQQIEEKKIKETLEKLCSHGNTNLAKQATTVLQTLCEGR